MLPLPESATETSCEDTLVHSTCPFCDPEGWRGLCGVDLSDDGLWEHTEQEAECTVCVHTDACPNCEYDFSVEGPVIIFDEAIRWFEQHY